MKPAVRYYDDFFASHRRWLLLLFVACIGIEYRPNIPGMPLNLSIAEIATFGVALIVLVDVVIWRESWWRELFARDTTKMLFTVWLVWLFVLGPTMVLRGDRYGLERLRDLLPALMCFLLVTSFVKSETDLRAVIRVWLFTVFVNVVLGDSQYLFRSPYPSEIGFTALGKLDLSGERYTGNLVMGFFTHPNGLGMVLVGPTLYFFWRLLHPSRFVPYLFDLAALVLVAGCLYLTQTRGAIYWALVGFATMVFGRFVSTRRTFLILIPAIGLVLLIVLAQLGVLGSSGTIQGRFTQWQAALSMLTEHPDVILFGGGAYPMARQSLLASHLAYLYPNAHNSLLNLVLFFGLPSLILFVLVAIRVLTGWPRAELGVAPPVAVPLIVISICLFLESLFEPFWEGNVPGGQLLLVLALLYAVQREGFKWQR
jgi:O-antigen ligase